MPLKFNKPSGVIMGTADKTYYLDKDGKVITDPVKAATILINEGQDIPKEMADKYGIGKPPGKEPAKAATEVDEASGAPKSAPAKANKAAKPAKNK
jgi:hypothetical protein